MFAVKDLATRCILSRSEALFSILAFYKFKRLGVSLLSEKVLFDSYFMKQCDLYIKNPYIRTLNFILAGESSCLKERVMCKWYINENFSLKVLEIVVRK